MDPLMLVLIVLLVLVLGAVVLLGLEFLQPSGELMTERVGVAGAVVERWPHHRDGRA